LILQGYSRQLLPYKKCLCSSFNTPKVPKEYNKQYSISKFFGKFPCYSSGWEDAFLRFQPYSHGAPKAQDRAVICRERTLNDH